MLKVDGYEQEIDLHAALTIAEDRVELDFTGTSGLSNKGINVPLNYATAYSVFALRCIIGPDIPNNAGSLAPVSRHRAKELHPERPASRTGGHAPYAGADDARSGLWLPVAGSCRDHGSGRRARPACMTCLCVIRPRRCRVGDEQFALELGVQWRNRRAARP